MDGWMDGWMDVWIPLPWGDTYDKLVLQQEGVIGVALLLPWFLCFNLEHYFLLCDGEEMGVHDISHCEMPILICQLNTQVDVVVVEV